MMAGGPALWCTGVDDGPVVAVEPSPGVAVVLAGPPRAARVMPGPFEAGELPHDSRLRGVSPVAVQRSWDARGLKQHRV
jgi:hypothetical protein